MSKAFINMQDAYQETLDALVNPPPSILLPEWPRWNKAVGGFRSREFSILCGPSGKGKTTFLANLSWQLLKQKQKHFVMSIECGYVDYMSRIISVAAGTDVNTGEAVSIELLGEIHMSNDEILTSGNIEYSVYENRVSVEVLKQDLLHAIGLGCRIAFIDNLNFFMEVTSAANQIIEMDRVIHELIIFCKQNDIHIVMVMHPRKTDNGRVGSIYDIKGSSTAIQEAQNVFLFNPSKDEDNHTGRELTLAKMRRRGKYTGSVIHFNCVETRYVERD